MESKNLVDRFQEIFNKYFSIRNVAILIGILAVLSFLTVSLVKMTSTTDYAVLYSHLSPDDAGSILTVLQEEKVPYKVEGNGSIIMVPKDKVYDIRLKLAAKGLPSGKIVGFEIFDEPKLGITQFQEHIEYIRALEGELQRTINRIDAVWSSKVNIALPKDSVFVRDTDEPKASVILKLWPGKDLTKEQVKAIVFLVSHAVPGLKPENVTVADNRGRVLSDLIQEDDVVGDTNKEIQIKRQLEREIERKVESMLSKALGSNKVIARATVEIETGKLEKQSEIYDPDMTAVVSERKIQEKELGVENKTAGVPGTGTNVPPVISNQGNGQIRNSREKKDVTTNYDVSKTVEKKVAPIFIIKKISVGVLIDGRYKKGANGTEEFIPRSPEELKTYENLIKSVVGFDQKRGDKVTVVSVPFEAPKSQIQVVKAETFPIIYLVIGGVVFIIFAGIVIFLILRKRKKQAEIQPLGISTAEAVKAYGVASETAEEKMEKERKEIESLDIKSDPSYIKILDIAKDHPELIVQLVKEWLGEKVDVKS
ncbi:flagellar basal-body MS-ring/collar protein FliF [Desulfurobacterium atlanticum]|uniref:Flagellar M-ring protein n=1 Tax=Desulfurobacterium atlanticum TaxID=240169 RepID=A0A238Z0J5_9BACT|nr:flagellar basal-body MS-ring/collar protein FliF [Desulfurobacterium atlanticum]SNR76448.1 flagellar M-ring protein FliF [Desulfurobacterium atlanticum]